MSNADYDRNSHMEHPPGIVPNAPVMFDSGAVPGVASRAAARRHVSRFFRSHALDTADAACAGFRHSHATVGALSLNHLTYGAETRIGIPPLRDFYLVQWTLAGTARYEHGDGSEVAAASGLYVINPDRAYEKFWDAACTQLIVRVDRTLIDDAVAALARPDGGPVLALARFGPGVVTETPRSASLFQFLRAVCADARTGGVGWAHPGLADRAGQVFAELLLTCLPHSEDARIAGARAPRPDHLSRAEDFIKVNARRPLRLPVIAAAAGVRPRTLHKAFQRHIGASPMAYLKQVRLDMARRDLMEAGRHGRGVTDVATDCGFDHLSKFAAAYKARYGESPSTTLRRFRSTDGPGSPGQARR